MSIPKKLESFLKRKKVYFQIVVHPAKVTSQEIAQAEHEAGRNVAKVVMVKAKGKHVMVVLPASHSLDLMKLSSALGTQDIAVEEEGEFKKLFPDCEAGAMPPFGRLVNLPTYIDASLKNADEIFFNGGSHTESVKISTADYLRAAEGKIGDYAVAGYKMAGKK